MNENERNARIRELEIELKELKAEASMETASNREQVLQYCRELKYRNFNVKAILYYRDKVGTGLIEAKNIIDSL